MCGTYLYMAPEVISHNKYDAKADLWSVGVMLYQMITGRRPFEACSSEDLFRKLGNKIQFRGEDYWDPDCRDLCEGLLRKNPLERISFEEFFNHKFLRGSSKAALVCDQEKADSVAILHRAPRPLETIPGDRQRPVRGRNPLMDSIEERIAREYVMVSSPSSSKNKHPHCPIPKPAPPPPRAHPPSKNSSKEDLERSETLRICAKLLGEVARFKLQDSKKLESLSLCLAALGSLKRALSIATTPQLLEDFSAALDETEAVAANLDRSSDQALPDAAEIIYQAALAAGRAGAVDEILEKRGRASVEYAKASTLLFFLIMDDSPIHLHSLDVASAHHCFHAITVRHKQCKNASH
ncbi:serine/threonine-protein kinase ATG1b [Selaginella moellendorffii]|uniref:serine/threonine-protein kinase ATG1b n=1 Tax=Selaginella moellendorffii TaxID=88036 RepID=UPI000D1C6615|nr:serine/threonine-protein kinase ATG1b [Selaginella moellendorffii]|eukprot:XP_024536215.1 serine/threonine-protein kinase ATG1b [Selaginella moellendorffii]